MGAAQDGDDDLLATLDDALCWAALSTLGHKGRERADIRAAGGARLALAGAAARASAIRRVRLLDPFLEGGGLILGGHQPVGRAEGHNPPLVMFGRGVNLLDDPAPAVAVVGARDATPAGESRARRIAEELARAGAIVVSGGARGVDRAAHEGAIACGGRSIAVLGEPLRPGNGDERPPYLQRLFDGAPGRALSVTMTGPWQTPMPYMYVARNEWIAALADAVIVVEGGPRSGTRHTVAYARRQGRRLLALPGDIDAPLAFTPNQLLRGDGSAYLPGGAGLADLMGRKAQLEDGPALLDLPGLAPVDPSPAHPVLAVLASHGGVIDVDSLAVRLGLAVEAIVATLAELELEGLVQQEGGLVRPAGNRARTLEK